MMKKLLFTLMAALVLFAGCADKSAMEKVPLPSDTTGVSSSAAPESTTVPTEASSSQNEPQSESESSGYLKKFTVVSCRGTAYVSALSQEEVDEYIGVTLDYQDNVFLYNGEPIDLPQDGYIEQPYPTEQFAQDFKTQASELGLTMDEVLSVTLNVEGNIFGNYFYVLDDDTLLVYYEGVFFEADSVS